MPIFEDFIFKGLKAACEKIKDEKRLPLKENDRYVIFSDHHKGGKNGADNFRQCEATYLAALEYYYQKGYTLVILGDAEELWEERIPTVMNAYRSVFQSEARFHPERYIKVFGNHDDKWRKERLVKKYLHPIFPGLKIHEGMQLDYTHPQTGVQGEIMLVHGHQGTFDSDRMKFWARIAVRLYKYFQILTGKGKTGPSKSNALRARHDRAMYLWSTQKERLNFILITGHTHRPVWSSGTHVEKLALQIREEKQRYEEIRRSRDHNSLHPLNLADSIQQKLKNIVELTTELKNKMAKYHSENDTLKTFPTYFNSGCCRFSDGDVTGLEIENHRIRLMKWGRNNSTASGFEREVLEEDPLSSLFKDIDFSALLDQVENEFREPVIVPHSGARTMQEVCF